MDTLRISMGWGWTYLVVVELVGATNGLGFQIQQAERYLDTPEIILGIIIIGVLGLIFDFSFKAIYAKAFPYMSRARDAGPRFGTRLSDGGPAGAEGRGKNVPRPASGRYKPSTTSTSLSTTGSSSLSWGLRDAANRLSCASSPGSNPPAPES